jgi:hypothetical protein
VSGRQGRFEVARALASTFGNEHEPRCPRRERRGLRRRSHDQPCSEHAPLVAKSARWRVRPDQVLGTVLLATTESHCMPATRAALDIRYPRSGPVGATHGGSQSGSQHAQLSGDAERHPASVTPVKRHTKRRGATRGDRLELIWEQEDGFEILRDVISRHRQD